MNTPRAKYLRKKYHIFIYTFLVAVVLSIGGYYFYSHEETAIKNEKNNDLIAISNLKIDQLTQWLYERRSEAHFFSSNPNFIKNAINLSTGINTDNAGNYFLSRLKPIFISHEYENILITDKDKTIIFAVNSENNHIDDTSFVMIEKALSKREIVFTDIFKCAITGRLMLEFIAPVFDRKGNPTAAIIFRINPTKYLYPLINSWPMPSKTAETLILRKEGDSALFLNELRHKKNTALKHKLQIINKNVPTIQAVLGTEGIFEGTDYRGVDVLSFISKIPKTEWFMIAKVDKSEIYSELNFKAAVIVLFILVLILFSATGLSWIYHYNQRNLFRELFSKEKELSEFHKQFKTTLYSIGDGVITTDKNGKVKEMNPVAENLTGWKEEDARGEELEKVFNIINETTRNKVENPVVKVLREGLVVGLANHTLLVSKDGTEIPISDSGAPINDEKGNITGVVLVFRDQSEERKKNREILETTEQLKASQRVARIGYYVFDVSKGEWISSEMLDEIFGIDNSHKHDLIGWLDLIHPEDRQTMSDYLVNHVLKENNDFNREYRIINKRTKEILWVKGIGNLEHNDEGFPVKMFGTIQDISEMKIKEEKILQLSRAVEQNPISVIITSPDGTIQYINPTWQIGGISCVKTTT
ncbi:MAG: PAS domain S-box protein [Melioribacteraceae bacterium]|nr:PAS domain S-box protein [Melioribacteraceae bacterium]MCF8356868.1 PAS domain S-box protein [Melioribacteraceae bacterium]MCF8394531.1 PAS domain S-box protein [Melioribacteraceae bacterium]MCF8420147.1 PAS domain S-box protein [Melioribacteraceae bacterium]